MEGKYLETPLSPRFPESLHGGSKDIFWNYTIALLLSSKMQVAFYLLCDFVALQREYSRLKIHENIWTTEILKESQDIISSVALSARGRGSNCILINFRPLEDLN